MKILKYILNLAEFSVFYVFVIIYATISNSIQTILTLEKLMDIHLFLHLDISCMINLYQHGRIQEFLPGGSRPNSQKTTLTFFALFFTVLQRLINGLLQRKLKFSKVSEGVSNIFQRGSSTFSRGGGDKGGPTFSRGGGGGLNDNLYRNP